MTDQRAADAQSRRKKRKKRMERFDALSPEMKAVVHDWGAQRYGEAS